jgi:hypothetical protein
MAGSPTPYSRRLYRDRRKQFIHANAAPLGLLALLVAAIGALLSQALHGYMLGLADGILVASFVGLVLTAFHATTGSIWQLAGAWGEENTRDVLRAAKRRRLIWGWVDGVAIADGDVDHLVVLRDGRLIAIDSKWHAKVGRGYLERDAHHAVRTAQRARSILRAVGDAWPVTPVVVVWGAGAQDVPKGATIDGVPIVAGRHLKQWLDQNDNASVRKRDADAILRALESFRERVHPQERALAG